MKSIFLLCNYDIAYNTILKLYEQNVTIIDIIYDPECLDKVFGSKSKKIEEIKLKMPYVLKSENMYSVYDLMIFGVSKSIVLSLLENNIKFEELNTVLLKSIFKGNSTINKIMNSYSQVIQSQSRIHDLAEQTLINLIKIEFKFKSFSKEDIFYILGESNYNLDSALNGLIEKRIVRKDGDQYVLAKTRLKDEIDKITNKKHQDIVIKKLNGMTLESIGTEYNVTRERIRQVVLKKLNAIHDTYEEDKYQDLFTTYHFDCDLFCELYDENKMVYYYLKEKNELGNRDPFELMENGHLSNHQLEVLKSKYNVIVYYGEKIIADRNNILLAVLKNKKNLTEYTDMITEYNKIIYNCNLELEPLTEDDFRIIDSILNRSKKVVSSLGKYYRYYDMDNLNNSDLSDLKNMLEVEPGDYSAEFFFNNNPMLMRKIDIRDEYELHNLLRKTIGDVNGEIIYSRMPDILINCQDKNEFIEELIHELSPISMDDFLEYVYQNYGHKMHTFRSLLQTFFIKYINNGFLIAECPEFSLEQIELLQSKLTKDIYLVSTVKDLLIELFNDHESKLFNNLNLDKLGYRLRGNYIMKSNISSIESYLRSKILSTDYYVMDPEMKKLGSTYSNYLNKMIYDLNLFMLDENKYITINGLNKLGIDRQDILEFQHKVMNQISDNVYFNLEFIKRNLDFSNLFKEGLTDRFFESILLSIPSIKSFRISGNKMFIKSENLPTREIFIGSIIEEKKKITIKELRKYLKEMYNINIIESDIRQYVNKKKYYYHGESDCVYMNKELHEKIIEQLDMFQYLF